MENKYWYVEVSATPEGMVNVKKFGTDSLLHSYVDVSGILHKIVRVASTFDLDSMSCKNMLFDYMEETGGLDKYGASYVKSTKGVNWLGDRSREYNLMYGRCGKLAMVYTDTDNVNNLLKLKENRGKLANNKKDLPTNKLEYSIKKCVKTVVKAIKVVNNIQSVREVPGVKL